MHIIRKAWHKCGPELTAAIMLPSLALIGFPTARALAKRHMSNYKVTVNNVGNNRSDELDSFTFTTTDKQRFYVPRENRAIFPKIQSGKTYEIKAYDYFWTHCVSSATPVPK